MGKINRVPRKNLIKKMDMSKPITLEMLGSEEDPCFGKHYDKRAAECQRCGDSELCAIKLGQTNHIQREKQEKKGAFKDMEEKDIPKKTKKELLRDIRYQIKDAIKFNSSVGGIDREALVNEMYILFGRHGFNQKRLGRRIDKLSETNPNIKNRKGKFVWKDNQ